MARGNGRTPKVPAKVPDNSEEALLWKQGSAFVFGVDEAGRGCLAGPVCAGVSCWAPFSSFQGLPVDVRDSKQMTELQREKCFEPIQQFSLGFGVGFASSQEIDKWNILKATHLAVARALEAALQKLISAGVLSLERDQHQISFLSDGGHPLVSPAKFFLSQKEFASEFPILRKIFSSPLQEFCFVKGDSRVFSIASASVLAKVSRDHLMMDLDQKYPAYEFALHKGYSTPRHIENLRKAGPCSEHRYSFSPVTEAAKLFS